jgi:AraC family transcriptional regulator
MHHTEYDKQKGIAITKVVEYIHCNLSENLTLSSLATIANYSPFHFQRLFLEQTGETPKQYIIRLRLEKNAHFLKVFPNLSISELAAESGFSSLSTFSRAFSKYFGISPDEFRKNPSMNVRKIGKTNRKKSKIYPKFTDEFWHVDFSQAEMENWKEKTDIEVSKVAGFTMAYVVTLLADSDAITKAFRALHQWAAPRNLIGSQTRYIGVLLDIPFITSIDKCRYWAGISIPTGMQTGKEITNYEMKSGLHAMFSMKGDLRNVLKNLVIFRHGWLDEAGYTLKDITGYEVFSDNPAFKPIEKIERRLFIPIKPV